MSEALPELKHSDPIYQGRVFNITVDRVAYPDGRTVKMECVRHRGSVVLLPMTAPDRILLVRQYRYVVNEWLWELPAGTLEPNEDPEAAALRECHEEVGKIAARAEKLWRFFPSPGFCDEDMNFFVLTDLRDRLPGEPAPDQDPDEILDVREFSVQEVREMVRNGQIRDMKTALGILLISGWGMRDEGQSLVPDP
jgi:ADP-ribose pyrophosphatase